MSELSAGCGDWRWRDRFRGHALSRKAAIKSPERQRDVRGLENSVGGPYGRNAVLLDITRYVYVGAAVPAAPAPLGLCAVL